MQKNEIGPSPHTTCGSTQNESIKGLNIRSETVKLLEIDLDIGSYYLDMTPKAQKITVKE